MNAIQEFRRTCQQCGTVWHSLVEREAQLGKEGGCNRCMMCVDLPRGAQWDRNRDAVESELCRLKKCPNCGSTNYVEEILTYHR